jgi:predicted acyltransferase
VALMILVNTPGSWSYVYWPLGHARWHGLTPTDLVFPFFLFAAGAALYFSYGRTGFRPDGTHMMKLAKRVLLLFGIGLFLHAYPFTGDWAEFRIMGVLQRIALAWGGAALMVFYLTDRARFLFGASLLLAYWAVLVVFGGDDPYALEGSVVAQVDMAVLGVGHMWKVGGLPFDPEGLLSTLPAVVSVLLGFEASRCLARIDEPRQACLWMLKWGGISLLAGLTWNLAWPINKSLWTGSYVLVTTGFALWLLAALTWLVDVRQRRRVVQPFIEFGMNPLFVYAVSWLWVKSYDTLIFIEAADGQTFNGNETLFRLFLAIIPDPYAASALFAVAHVLLVWLLAKWLYRCGIFIKI